MHKDLVQTGALNELAVDLRSEGTDLCVFKESQ